MNNIRIYAFFWMIVLLTVSCYEDKGNYDYHPINEVKISGIKEDPYEILRWDTLKIPVTLENSLNEKAKLIYAWYLDQKKIAETEDLCYVVSDRLKNIRLVWKLLCRKMIVSVFLLILRFRFSHPIQKDYCY